MQAPSHIIKSKDEPREYAADPRAEINIAAAPTIRMDWEAHYAVLRKSNIRSCPLGVVMVSSNQLHWAEEAKRILINGRSRDPQKPFDRLPCGYSSSVSKGLSAPVLIPMRH
jgi:hypothetical protein